MPGVDAAIARYFLPWTDDVIDAQRKAYPDDRYPIGADWQLTDFMRRLGFVFPVDRDINTTGETFYMEVGRK